MSLSDAAAVSCLVQNVQNCQSAMSLIPAAVWPDWVIYCTLGNFSKTVATIMLLNLPIFLNFFCKSVKTFHFLVKSFLCNFYRHLVTFNWSHWIPRWRRWRWRRDKITFDAQLTHFSTRGSNQWWPKPDVDSFLRYPSCGRHFRYLKSEWTTEAEYDNFDQSKQRTFQVINCQLIVAPT